jgi:hypothetical protein
MGDWSRLLLPLAEPERADNRDDPCLSDKTASRRPKEDRPEPVGQLSHGLDFHGERQDVACQRWALHGSVPPGAFCLFEMDVEAGTDCTDDNDRGRTYLQFPV